MTRLKSTAARMACATKAHWMPRFSARRRVFYNDISEEAAALLEFLVNNHAFLDGNKRVGFAAMHTFLLVNGFDLDVSSKAAYEFIIRAMEEGKFCFGLIREWIAARLVPLPA